MDKSISHYFYGGLVCWNVLHLETICLSHGKSSQRSKRTVSHHGKKKLYKIIMTPAMILTVLLGIIMLIMNWDYFIHVKWIWIKILIVLFLIYWHFLAYYYIKQFDQNQSYPSKQFRVMNEIPTLILIAVVILAILKPF